MIHLYTGDGKGKTTAAIGQAVRAYGAGYRVLFAQFMKGSDTAELKTLQKLDGVEILRSPRDFGFYNSMSKEDKAELTGIHNEILDRILRTLRQKSESEGLLLVLDEITYPLNWNLLDAAKLEELLRLCHEKESGKNEKTESGSEKEMQTELVMTGRDAAEFLTKAADYITEMKNIRHPYDKGTAARKGIEY